MTNRTANLIKRVISAPGFEFRLNSLLVLFSRGFFTKSPCWTTNNLGMLNLRLENFLFPCIFTFLEDISGSAKGSVRTKTFITCVSCGLRNSLRSKRFLGVFFTKKSISVFWVRAEWGTNGKPAHK